jgi:hypothetical protein
MFSFGVEKPRDGVAALDTLNLDPQENRRERCFPTPLSAQLIFGT